MIQSEINLEPKDYCGNASCDEHCVDRGFIFTTDNETIQLNTMIKDPSLCVQCSDAETNYTNNHKVSGTGNSGANKGGRRKTRGGSPYSQR